MAGKLDLTAQLAAQMQGRHWGPQAPEAYDKPTNIVVARNGIFRVVKTPIALFKKKLSDIPAASAIPGLEAMEEGPELLIPKIPGKYLAMVLTWYREIYQKDKTEASVLFFWNHDDVEIPAHYEPTQVQKNQGKVDGDPVKGLLVDGKLVVYCPQQKNSSGLSEFGDDGMVEWLRANMTGLLETHSHHTMNAFWSGTDNANENATQFYGVWGKILDKDPKFLFRWVAGDAKIDIDYNILFDMPETKITTVVTTEAPGQEPVVTTEVKTQPFSGPWPDVAPPEDWTGQHRKSYYAPKTTTYAGKYNGGTTGGAANKGTTQSTPSRGGQQYNDPYYGTYYDDETGYPYDYGNGRTGYGQAWAQGNQKTHGSEDEVKKNDVTAKKLSEESRAVVDIVLTELDEEKIAESEDMVKYLVGELINNGFDHIVADVVAEQSGYGHHF